MTLRPVRAAVYSLRIQSPARYTGWIQKKPRHESAGVSTFPRYRFSRLTFCRLRPEPSPLEPSPQVRNQPEQRPWDQPVLRQQRQEQPEQLEPLLQRELRQALQPWGHLPAWRPEHPALPGPWSQPELQPSDRPAWHPGPIRAMLRWPTVQPESKSCSFSAFLR